MALLTVRTRQIGLAISFLVLATAAHGVTWFTVNGQTSGALTLPGQLVFRADTTSAGGMVRIAIGVDADHDGTLEAGETVLDPLCVRDGAYNDESAQSRVVQFTRTMATGFAWGHIGVAVVDEDGTMLQYAYQVVGPATGQTISGWVRDSLGSPVAGAVVAAEPITFERLEGWDYQTITAPNGSFSMQVPVGHYEVAAGWIEAGLGSVPAIYRFALVPGQSRADLRFTLDRYSGGPNAVSGRLTGPAGEPVMGHMVLATAGAGAITSWTRTDVEGAYRLEITPNPDYPTWEVKPHWIRFADYYYAGLPVTVSLPPDRSGLDFSMSAAANACRGDVGSDGGGHIRGARVVASIASSAGVAETNAQGRYAVYLPNGSYFVDASAPGFASGPTDTAGCTVPPDAWAYFGIQPENITISGRVTRADTGAGAPYVRIWADPLIPEWWGFFESRSDADGYYTIHLPPGTWTMHLESALLGSWLFQDVDATANRTGVNLSMGALNLPPVLSNGSVSPQSGAAGTTFTYRVTYTDYWPPIQVYAFLDGWPRLMQPVDPSDTDATDGIVFECTAHPGAGLHTFAFGAIETVSYAPGNIIGLPVSGSYSGPTVTAADDPVVSIGSPVNGATVKGTMTVTAAASDSDGIQKVEFYDSATLESTDTSPPYQWNWLTKPLSVAEGWHTIYAKAYDNAGHSTIVGIWVNVDNTTFDDVPKTASLWPYAEALVRESITGGCSASPPLYCPDSGVTRAQMAKFLCIAAGKLPLDTASPTFADVPKTSWAYTYVERLADAASWGGTPPTGGCRVVGTTKYFCPNDSVTREQMAKFLCVAAGKSAMSSCAGTFGDVTSGSMFCTWIERLADPASWGGSAVTSGCATGPPRLYCPKANVTRGQMAVFLVKAFGITL